MHIGIDLDNTILDATTAHLRVYNRLSGKAMTAADVTEFFMYRLYGWDQEERDAIYYAHGHEIHEKSEPFADAIPVLQQLADEHRLSFITARPLRFRDVTVSWLTRHGIRYNHIAFVEDKLEHCVRTAVDVLIDDGPHYARQFAAAQRPVILYDQLYNADVEHDLVYRARNWSEVKHHLEAFL